MTTTTITDVTDRDAYIEWSRREGATLQEIADTVNLTRERVRQILRNRGVDRVTRDDRIVAAADEWRLSGLVRHPRDVAEEYGLGKYAASVLGKMVPELSLPSKWTTESQAITEDEAVEAVRSVALKHGYTNWMSVAAYEKLREPGMPSTALITSRFHWKEIAAAAGLDASIPKESAPGWGDRQFSDQDIDRAVLRFLLDTNRKSLSAKEFELFLARETDLPSLATIRNRFRRRGVVAIADVYLDVQDRYIS